MFDFEMFLVPSQWLLTPPTQVTNGHCTESQEVTGSGAGCVCVPQIPVKLVTVASGNQENLGDSQLIVLTWGPASQVTFGPRDSKSDSDDLLRERKLVAQQSFHNVGNKIRG